MIKEIINIKIREKTEVLVAGYEATYMSVNVSKVDTVSIFRIA